jgi:hypothetical protein
MREINHYMMVKLIIREVDKLKSKWIILALLKLISALKKKIKFIYIANGYSQ